MVLVMVQTIGFLPVRSLSLSVPIDPGPRARGDHGGDAVRDPDRHPNPSPGADGDGFSRRRTGLCGDAPAPLPR
jgi:hypothetical protein